jgi:hypothetical protein
VCNEPGDLVEASPVQTDNEGGFELQMFSQALGKVVDKIPGRLVEKYNTFSRFSRFLEVTGEIA